MAYETLYPNAAGDETSITLQFPNSTAHWDKVDETPADDNTTYIYCTGSSYLRDLYKFPVLSVTDCIIDSVAIHFRIKSNYDVAQGLAKPSQKSGATVTDGTQVGSGVVVGTWTDHSQTYTLNPATGAKYTLAQVNALQAGVSLNANVAATYYVGCTQVYIVVSYHINVVTSATSRVTALMHYYSRAKGLYRLSINVGGLAPLMMPYLESKNPPNPQATTDTTPPTTDTTPPTTDTTPPTTDTTPPVTPGTPNTRYPDYPGFIQPVIPPVLPIGQPSYAPELPNYYGQGYDPTVPYYGGTVGPGNGEHLPTDYTIATPPPVIQPTQAPYAPMLKDYYFKGYDPSKPYYGGGKQ